MKKKILSALFCLISAASAIAVEPGYRGFVDLGYALSVSELQVTAQVQKVKDIEGSCNAVTFKLGFDF